ETPEQVYLRLLKDHRISMVLTGTRTHLEETVGYVQKSGEEIKKKIPASTMIDASSVENIIKLAGEAIREFLKRLAPYVDNPAGSSFADIAGVKELWVLAREYQNNPA